MKMKMKKKKFKEGPIKLCRERVADTQLLRTEY